MQLKLDNLPEIMSVEQVAQYLGTSRQTIYNWCGTKDIPSFKVGNTRRIRKSVMLVWIERQEKEATG